MASKIKSFLNFYQKRKKISQYRLLSVFEYQDQAYALRINKKSLEVINLKTQKIIKIKSNADFDIKKVNQGREFKVSKINAEDLILSFKTKEKGVEKVKNYLSRDLTNWEPFSSKVKTANAFSIVSDYSFEKNKIAYYQKNNRINYCKIKYFSIVNKNRETDIKEELKNKETDKIISAEAYSEKKVLFLFYYVYKNQKEIILKVAIMDKENPSRLLFMIDKSLFKSKSFDFKLLPLGIIKIKDGYQLYCKDKNEKLYLTKLPPIDYQYEFSNFKHFKDTRSYQRKNFSLDKSQKNPIMKPRENVRWESNGTFNPAAIKIKDKIHLIYRAVGEDYSSVFGYACTEDGSKIKERSKTPIYKPQEHFELRKDEKFSFRYPYMSGGGWGGCEDPRLSIVEDRIFMTYTAFNGQIAPGVALTSIKIDDFLNKKWKWERPFLISEPGKIQKNWVIFPEKIKGKYAILHSISPEISIDYFDNLISGQVMIKSRYSKNSDNLKWENYLRGVASPPIKTKKGWLLFYHAMDHKNPDQYKLGMMMLDLKDPSKIKYRCANPILEPKEFYENDGKPGVIYACGSVIKDEKVLIYYGGGDKVSCLASVELKKLLDTLINSEQEGCFKEIKIKII